VARPRLDELLAVLVATGASGSPATAEPARAVTTEDAEPVVRRRHLVAVLVVGGVVAVAAALASIGPSSEPLADSRRTSSETTVPGGSGALTTPSETPPEPSADSLGAAGATATASTAASAETSTGPTAPATTAPVAPASQAAPAPTASSPAPIVTEPAPTVTEPAPAAAPVPTAAPATAVTEPALAPSVDADPVAFLVGYFDQVEAGRYDVTWSMLSGGFQRGKAVSYEYYASFWDRNDVELLDAAIVESTTDQVVVDATLRWNGAGATVERFTLEALGDGTYVISGQRTVA
jgi:hypothetical protein